VFQLDFPTVKTIAKMTAYCSLDLKPSPKSVVSDLEKTATERQAAIYRTLSSGAVPENIELPKEDVAILHNMLKNMPNILSSLQDARIINDLANVPDQERQTIVKIDPIETVLPKSLVPYNKTISTQEVRNNISGQ
jgi:hypothetical protein